MSLVALFMERNAGRIVGNSFNLAFFAKVTMNEAGIKYWLDT